MPGKPYLQAALLAGVLLSCSTAPKTDPLEAKAQAGDPVAACQLAARAIHACALQKTANENALVSERLACYETMLDDRKKGYLDKAEAALKAQSDTSVLPYMATVVHLHVLAATLPILGADEAAKYTAELDQECADLAKGAG